MKKKSMLIAVALLLLFAFSACRSESYVQQSAKGFLDSLSSAEGLNMMPFAKALELIEVNPESVFVVDMRSADDYNAGHLPGAVHVPYAAIGEQMTRFPADRKILLYCYSGQTSGQAVAAAVTMGFDAVSLQSGMNFGWAPLGLGVDTLQTSGNSLPAVQNHSWNDDQKTLHAAIVDYFSAGTNYIVNSDVVNNILRTDPISIAVLDIRNQEAFDEARIERSVLIPFLQLGSRINEVPGNRPVYVVCFSGQTAGQAIFALRLYGVDAYSIGRGMIGWNGANMPVISSGTASGATGGCE